MNFFGGPGTDLHGIVSNPSLLALFLAMYSKKRHLRFRKTDPNSRCSISGEEASLESLHKGKSASRRMVAVYKLTML